jgi:hypothetical protein
VRREYLDEILFWNQSDLERSSRIIRHITTNIGVTLGWPELRLLNAVAHPLIQSQTFSHIHGSDTATHCFRPQSPHELQFATHPIDNYDAFV